MRPASAERSGPRQTRVLFGTFLARFFEHESTAGRTDLRESFFWLIGAIGAPGLMFAFYQHFHWHALMLRPGGLHHLRVESVFDKALYLTFTSVVMGLISVAVWNALIVDRRDALILGVLPVRRREIVAAKLLSLGAYVGVLNLGMHLGASLLFGGFLGGTESLLLVPREIAAHLVSASAVGMFVFLAVVALESGSLAIVGPRHFARVAAALQVVLIASFMLMLLMAPTIAGGSVLLARGQEPAWWIRYLPSVWFTGLYEALAGTVTSPSIATLAGTALTAFATMSIAVVTLYPIACWRVLSTAVSSSASSSLPWNRMVGAWLVRVLAASHGTRAALQFLIATAGRLGRFRMVMSAALGLGLALIAPIVLYLMSRGVPNKPSLSLLAAPALLSVTLVAGWRIVTAMPAELPARWVFRSTQMDPFEGRTAVRRMMFTAGVLAPLVLFVPAWIVFWGVGPSWPLLINALLAGGILVEAHLWGFAGMPSSRPLAVSDSNIQGRWPFYGLGLMVYVVTVSQLGIRAAGHIYQWLLLAVLAAGYVTVRSLSDDAARVNVITDDFNGLIILDLATVAPGLPQPAPLTVDHLQKEVPRA